MLFRNNLFDLKSDVLKINTNIMQLIHEIFFKRILILRSHKILIKNRLDILSKSLYILCKKFIDIPKYV